MGRSDRYYGALRQLRGIRVFPGGTYLRRRLPPAWGDLNPLLRVPTLDSTMATNNIARHAPLAGVAKEKPAEAEMEAKRRGGYATLDVMEKPLSSRASFVGDRYSIADIALYAYRHMADQGGFSLHGYDAIRGWLERVRSQRHVPITA